MATNDRDIAESERKALRHELAEARRAIEQAEARASNHRFLAESIPQQVWTATANGALDFVSSVVLAYFRQSSDAILGAGWVDLIHDDDRAPCVERWTESLATGVDYEVEFRLRRHDGAYRWHLGRAVPERDLDGRIVRWFGTNTDIDDRKTTEAELYRRQQALSDREARLRLALDAGRMGDWEWNIGEGRVIWSTALERIHGIAEGSFDGTFEAYQSDLHPDDRQWVLEAIRRSVAERLPHELQYRIIRPDGEVRWLEARGKLLHERPSVVVGVCSDITDRRRAEETARRLVAEEAARMTAVEAEESIRQILESISDPMLILDRDWRIDYVNDSGAALLSKSRDDLYGRNLWATFPDAVGTKFHAEYHRARRENVVVSFEELFVPLGTWFEVTAYPTRDGRLSVQYRSINARKAADALHARENRRIALRADVAIALAHRETLAEMLQESALAIVRHLGVAFVGIWTSNHETGVLELAARGGEAASGDGPPERVQVGQFQIGSIASEGKPHLTNDLVNDPRLTNRNWADKNQIVAFAGYPLLVAGRCNGVVALYSKRPLADDTLSVIAAVADTIAHGVEHKHAERALEEHARELLRSNAELERFAYVASHDLQEPLRMVASYTQLLGRRYRGKLDSDADEFIGFAVDGANRMQALIDDLLAFSRVGTRAGQHVVEPLDVPLGAALANLRKALADSGGTVTHDPLPSLLVDRQQVLQLFQNLIGNALKFRGAEPPRVHVSAQRDGQDWTFSVRDNGIGIAEEYFERLFVVFQRLHTRTEYPGNGIGLAICKKIVERHGGRIWVESKPASGATFFFTLRGGK